MDAVVYTMDGHKRHTGDVAVWQRIPVKTSVYQGGCISKGNVLERRNGTI